MLVTSIPNIRIVSENTPQVPVWQPNPNQPLIPTNPNLPSPTLPGEGDEGTWDPWNPPLYG